MLAFIPGYPKMKLKGGIKWISEGLGKVGRTGSVVNVAEWDLRAGSIIKLGIVMVDLTLIDDDEIEVISPPTTCTSVRRASTPLPQPRSTPPSRPAPPPQRRNSPRAPPPQVIELNDDDDDDIVEILPPARQPPRADLAPEPRCPNEPPSVPVRDEPMLDLNDLILGEHPPTPPPSEFPSSAKHADVPEHRFGPMEGTRCPGPSLPPALRARSRIALGQRMQDVITSDALVQSLGLKVLKVVGWRAEKRERIASVIPDWARPPNDKGKARDPRERRPQPITELRLLPPRLRVKEIKSGSESYPPRKPRKSSVTMHRDNTVKLEPVDLSFS